MKELISLLDMRERRLAAWLGACLGAAACLINTAVGLRSTSEDEVMLMRFCHP